MNKYLLSAAISISLVIHAVPVLAAMTDWSAHGNSTKAAQSSVDALSQLREKLEIEFVGVDNKLDPFYEKEAKQLGRKAVALNVKFINKGIDNAKVDGAFFLVDQNFQKYPALDVEELPLAINQPLPVRTIFYIPTNKTLSFSMLWMSEAKFPNGKHVSFLIPLTPGVRADFSGESHQNLVALQRAIKKAAEAKAKADKKRVEEEAKAAALAERQRKEAEAKDAEQQRIEQEAKAKADEQWNKENAPWLGTLIGVGLVGLAFVLSQL